jgi:hypothetical protein
MCTFSSLVLLHNYQLVEDSDLQHSADHFCVQVSLHSNKLKHCRVWNIWCGEVVDVHFAGLVQYSCNVSDVFDKIELYAKY